MEYTLPDKTVMTPWQDETDYKKVYYVDNKNPVSSDSNPGTKEQPLKTISAAAKIVKSGEKVVISEGVYRECVRPENFGEAANKMICFESAQGERVEITGAEILKNKWKISNGWKKTPSLSRENNPNSKAKIYMTKLPGKSFVGVNPFSVANGPMYPWWGDSIPIYWAREKTQQNIVTQKTGLIFCDGVRLHQVSDYSELYENNDCFWVEGDGFTVHIHLKENNNPESHLMEYTARNQCFCPEDPFGGYIHIRNIIFTKVGNIFPPPQSGAVSTNCGHHFIIENCTVEDVNSVGVDIGFQCPRRFSDSKRGFNQVIGCTVKNCGICGICGTSGGSSDYYYLDQQQEGIYIWGNRLYNCSYHNFAQLWENAAIKIHHMKDSVIACNYINGVPHGMGIWADASNSNIAVTENVVLHSCNEYGAIMLEASLYENHISHNIVVDSKQDYGCVTERGGSGIYSHCCDEVKNYGNIVLGCEYAGIRMLNHEPFRITHGGRGNTGYGMEYRNNIISDCEAAILQPNEKGLSDRNIFGTFTGDGYLEIKQPLMRLNLAAWQKWLGWDKNSRMTYITYRLSQDEKRLIINIGNKQYRINLFGGILNQIETFWSE